MFKVGDKVIVVRYGYQQDNLVRIIDRQYKNGNLVIGDQQYYTHGGATGNHLHRPHLFEFSQENIETYLIPQRRRKAEKYVSKHLDCLTHKELNELCGN